MPTRALCKRTALKSSLAKQCKRTYRHILQKRAISIHAATQRAVAYMLLLLLFSIFLTTNCNQQQLPQQRLKICIIDSTNAEICVCGHVIDKAGKKIDKNAIC